VAEIRPLLPSAFVLALLAAALLAPAANAAQPEPALMGVLWQASGAHNATLWCVRWSPDGSMVAAAYFDNITEIFNSTTGRSIARLSPPPQRGRCEGYTPAGCFPLRSVAWSPDGRRIAMGGNDKAVTVFWTGNWTVERVFTGHTASILTTDFSPDGRYIASGSGTDKVEMDNAADENDIRIWDLENGTQVADMRGHRDGVMEVRWSPDGKRLVSASDDKTVRLWRTSNWTLEGELRGHTLGVLCADFSPDGSRLVTGSRDYTVRLWNLTDNASGFAQAQKWPAPNCVRSVDWHPGGDLIACSGVDETLLVVRNATSGVVLRTFTESAGTRSAVMSSRWSPDGERLAAGAGKEATLRVYAAGKLRQPAAEAIPWWVQPLVIYGTLSWGFSILFMYWAWKRMERERR
jgi:WD40 repeat protein